MPPDPRLPGALLVPEHFETSERKRIRESAELRESELQFEQLGLEEDYRHFCREQVNRRIDRYSPEKLEQSIREHLAAIKREQPEWFARIPQVTQREVAHSRLQTAIMAEANLPSFETWRKSDVQRNLF